MAIPITSFPPSWRITFAGTRRGCDPVSMTNREGW